MDEAARWGLKQTTLQFQSTEKSVGMDEAARWGLKPIWKGRDAPGC